MIAFLKHEVEAAFKDGSVNRNGNISINLPFAQASELLVASIHFDIGKMELPGKNLKP